MIATIRGELLRRKVAKDAYLEGAAAANTGAAALRLHSPKPSIAPGSSPRHHSGPPAKTILRKKSFSWVPDDDAVSSYLGSPL